MSIYIGNDLEDKLKILETENASLKKYYDYHQVVHEIDHGSVNRFPHFPPVGILPTLASTKSRQGGGLDPFLSAANIGRVGV